MRVGDLLERVVRPLQVEGGNTYQEIGIRSHCKGIFHKTPVTGQQIGEKRVFWIEPGCLIFNIIFAWEHAIALTTENERGLIASHRFPMYRSTNGILLPEFAYLYFSSPRGKYDLALASPGGAGRNKTLGQEEFKRLRIPVPPLREQHEIVEILKTWDREISQTEKLIAAKRRLKQGLMQQLLTGKRRFPEFTGKWPRYSFGEIASLGKKRHDPKKNGNRRRCVELEHIAQVDGRLLDTVHSDAQQSSKSVFSAGDVLFGKLRPNLRKFIHCSFDGVCSTEIWVLKVNPEICCSDYLFCLVQTDRFIAAACTTTGSKMPRADWDWVSEQMFRLPPKPEQEKISRSLGMMDREIERLSQLADQLKYQKRGLVQKLLTGKVRVRV